VDKGLVISLILIVFGLVLYFAGQMMNRSLGMDILSNTHCCVLLCRYVNFAKQKNGNVTFGNVFAHGFKITAAVIVIMAFILLSRLNLFIPEMIDKMQEAGKGRYGKERRKNDRRANNTGPANGKKFFMGIYDRRYCADVRYLWSDRFIDRCWCC
jgi:hypothetical protein